MTGQPPLPEKKNAEPAPAAEVPSTLPPAPRSGIASLRWPLVVIFALILAYLAWSKPWELVGTTAKTIRGITRDFSTNNITTTFIASLPQLVGDGTNKLEVGETMAVEVFTKENNKRILWDYISLGTTVTEIRVPVTYRYHLPLDASWTLEVQDKVCVVRAPALRPNLPPAIHTDKMEKRTDTGWLRFNAKQQMASLEKSITPTLGRKARDQRHLSLVRDQCRMRVASFVRDWLLREDHWRSDRFAAIRVYFADEKEEPDTRPTISLEPETGNFDGR